MTSDLQTLIALGIVALAVILLVRSALKKRTGSGCSGGGCGCPTSEFKAKLKR